MVSAHRVLLTVLLATTACRHGAGGPSSQATPVSAPGVLVAGFTVREPVRLRAGAIESPCTTCDVIPMSPDLTRVVEDRLADLRARGGSCARYGSVLEASYRSGRITIRPYMWRVGSQLASGEAKPNGDMTLALEIDSLNVGVRTVDEVVWSMEHEAVHIAFDIASGSDVSEERANRYVRECRG